MKTITQITLLGFLLIAPQMGLKAEGDQQLPNGKPFDILKTQIDGLDQRLLDLEDPGPPSDSDLIFSGHFDEGIVPNVAVQLGWQIGGVIIPEQNIKGRRLVTQQVVVDHVIPNQVIGPHHIEYPRQFLAIENTLFGRCFTGLIKTIV